jgi:hypothetical protein
LFSSWLTFGELSASFRARKALARRLTAGQAARLEQFQYLDVGMNIDCRFAERDKGLWLYISIDSSSFSLPEEQRAWTVSGQPIVRELRSQLETVVRPGNPILVSSMDDPSSKRRFQLEVTATKVR